MRTCHPETDAAVLDRARRVVAAKPRMRLVMLAYALLFLGFAVYCTVASARKINGLEEEQLRAGFLYGVALAVVWTSFGLVGAICFGKFLIGFARDFRSHELLVRYHDLLRDLGQLPDDYAAPDGAANGSQLIRSETNQPSTAAGSRR